MFGLINKHHKIKVENESYYTILVSKNLMIMAKINAIIIKNMLFLFFPGLNNTDIIFLTFSMSKTIMHEIRNR